MGDADGRYFYHLGGKEDAHRSNQLELGLVDVDRGEDPVQIVDSMEVYFRMTVLLLAHLQHPVSHYLPHVKKDGGLDCLEIIFSYRGFLSKENIFDNSFIGCFCLDQVCTGWQLDLAGIHIMFKRIT